MAAEAGSGGAAAPSPPPAPPSSQAPAAITSVDVDVDTSLARPPAHTGDVLRAWETAPSHVHRVLHVDPHAVDGVPRVRREVAAFLGCRPKRVSLATVPGPDTAGRAFIVQDGRTLADYAPRLEATATTTDAAPARTVWKLSAMFNTLRCMAVAPVPDRAGLAAPDAPAIKWAKARGDAPLPSGAPAWLEQAAAAMIDRIEGPSEAVRRSSGAVWPLKRLLIELALLASMPGALGGPTPEGVAALRIVDVVVGPDDAKEAYASFCGGGGGGASFGAPRYSRARARESGAIGAGAGVGSGTGSSSGGDGDGSAGAEAAEHEAATLAAASSAHVRPIGVHVVVNGPAGTLYAGQTHVIRLEYGRDMPFRPPLVTVLTPLLTPGLMYPERDDRYRDSRKWQQWAKARACISWMEEDWSPALGADAVVRSIGQLLLDPVATAAAVEHNCGGTSCFPESGWLAEHGAEAFAARIRAGPDGAGYPPVAGVVTDGIESSPRDGEGGGGEAGGDGGGGGGGGSGRTR